MKKQEIINEEVDYDPIYQSIETLRQSLTILQTFYLSSEIARPIQQ